MVGKPPLCCHPPARLRQRPDASLERRRAVVGAPRDRILITCDQTTELYFSGLLRHFGLVDRVVLRSCHVAEPMVVVASALQALATSGPFHRMYALVDHDGLEKSGWQQAKQIESDHNFGSGCAFRIITSIPSFDLWLLLHWVDSSLEYGNGEKLVACLRSQLQRHSPLEELKGDSNLFELLQPSLHDAIRRSQSLSRMDNTDDAVAPVTEVHELVTYLFKWQNRLQNMT